MSFYVPDERLHYVDRQPTDRPPLRVINGGRDRDTDIERRYRAWCAEQGVEPTPLPDPPTTSTRPAGGTRDPRRSTLNPNWILIGDEWTRAPLARPADPAPTTVPDQPILTDHERLQLASTDAQLVAARARADADAGRPMLAPVDVDHLEPDPAEAAAIAAKWVEVNRRIGGGR